ncbi:MAG TPA: metalloregulator ArsR/SmtB family transcription factor [Candidatus Dormibacteraeota bacterium]|nr:metalloregulator ArsR/SmtB family transcription factor [Candidatus Dormibacteraeota bacterium]
MATLELPVRERGKCCEIAMPVDPARARRAASLLKALGDPTRLSMILCLWKAQAPVCICDFTATFDLGQPTISHHMAKLRAAGLVESQKRGIWIYYRLRDDLAPATVALLGTLLAASEGPSAG